MQSSHVPDAPHQRADTPRARSEPAQPQGEPAPTPQEQSRRACIQQTAKASIAAKAPERSTIPNATPIEKRPRQRMEDIRTRPEAKQAQGVPTSAPQGQGRRAYVQRAKKSRAEKSSARDHLHTEQAEIQFTDDLPPTIREKLDAPQVRSQVQSEATPAKPSAVHHVKQSGAWTPRSVATPVMRDKEQPIRERPAVTQSHDLPPAPQEQARQAFAEKQAQLSQNPSIESIYPSETAAPIPPQLPVSDAPTITPERHPVTAGSKPAPPVQPPPTQSLPAEQPPAIREKPKPNAAPREKSQRGVDIRTRDTEQITPPTVQSKTSVSKIDSQATAPLRSRHHCERIPHSHP